MKTIFKYGIATFSGTIDDITFGSYLNGRLCIARKWVIPKVTAQVVELGSAATNIAGIYSETSAGYKADLKTYAGLYGKQKQYRKKISPNSYGLFVKLLYLFAEDQGESVDLKSLTLNDIQSLFSDMDSIAAACEAGYLPKLPGYAALTQGI